MIVHHVFFLSECFARNLREIWRRQIPDLYNHDHQGFCFGKEQWAKTNRSSPETLLQLDGAETEPFLLCISRTQVLPCINYIPFLLRLLVMLKRKFAQIFRKELNFCTYNHIFETIIEKTHPFEVPAYHVIDKRPSLKTKLTWWVTPPAHLPSTFEKKHIELQHTEPFPKRVPGSPTCLHYEQPPERPREVTKTNHLRPSNWKTTLVQNPMSHVWRGDTEEFWNIQ